MMRQPLDNYNAVLSGRRRPRFMKVDLETKSQKARELLKSCELCERKCRADRVAGKTGFCSVGDDLRVVSMFDHWGEEPFFIPSFTIFFWSCTFSCQFCQNWRISQGVDIPSRLSPKTMSQAINSCSCKNFNLVGGEPTPYLPMIFWTAYLLVI